MGKNSSLLLKPKRVIYSLFILVYLVLCPAGPDSGLAAEQNRSEAFIAHVASYKGLKNAEMFSKILAGKGLKTWTNKIMIPDKGEFYRVYVGPFESRDSALKAMQKLKRERVITYFAIEAKSTIPSTSEPAQKVRTVLSKPAPQSPETSRTEPIDPAAQAKVDYEEALKRIRAGRNAEALPLLEQALKVMPDDRHLQGDYVLCLVWTGDYQKAIEFYSTHEKELRQLRYVPRNMAKAYYELREYTKALELYRLGSAYDPKDEEAFKGIVYTQLRMGAGAGAYTTWLEAKKTGQVPPHTLDAVKLVLLEQYGGSLEALQVAKEGKVGQTA